MNSSKGSLDEGGNIYAPRSVNTKVGLSHLLSNASLGQLRFFKPNQCEEGSVPLRSGGRGVVVPLAHLRSAREAGRGQGHLRWSEGRERRKLLN
jgi:hypothetical protein